MNIMSLVYGLGFLSFFLTCSANNNTDAGPAIVTEKVPDRGAAVKEVNSEIDVADRKIVQTGYVSFETQNAAATATFIRQLVSEYNAYSSSDYINNYSGRVDYSITIRLPYDSFEEFINKLEKHAGHFESKNITANDVTEEYIDIEARLKTKRDLEKRYLELLSKAAKLDEVINIEKELNNVRSEIESIEGRLKYLSNQVAMSTITVTYYEKVYSDFGFLNKTKQAIRTGWSGLKWFIIGLISLWPFLILSALGYFLYKKRYRR